MNIYKIFYKICKQEAEKMSQECKSFIGDGDRILDVGCGSGITAKFFKDFFKAELTGVDVKDYRVDPIAFRLINGKNLPFPDGSFDVALINFVLHHTKDPAVLLRESKRVANTVIIYEDNPDGFFSKLICLAHIYFSSQKKTYSTISSLSSFKKAEKWEQFFNELGFSVLHKKKIKRFWPLKKIRFVLKSNPSN